MGVTGLWRLIEPAGKPVPVETLENKVLAVDISIWLHQVVKGYQDAKGAPMPNAHLIGLFQRVCKLLYFRIKPVFVFDGAFPELKKETIGKRQDNKLKYNSESERIKRELALLLSKKTAISTLLGKQISPTKKSSSSGQNDDLFKLPVIPQRPESESEESEDEEDTSSGSIVDLHSVDVESESFKTLPVKEKYNLLLDLKDTRKMNSWGKLHELPKKSDNFSDFQMQRLLKRRKVQECLEETEKEMGDAGMSMNDLESLLNEEGIDTKIETLPTRRIAANNTTRFLLINDVKQALAEAKKKKEVEAQASSSKIQEVINKPPEPEGNTKKDELEEDLEKAIKMSLECVSEADTSVCTSKTDESWTTYDTDYSSDSEEEDGCEPPDLSSAKAYIMQYSDFTDRAIDEIVSKSSKNNKNKVKKAKLNQILEEINKEKSVIVDNVDLSSSDDEDLEIIKNSRNRNETTPVELNVSTDLDSQNEENVDATQASVVCLGTQTQNVITLDSSLEDSSTQSKEDSKLDSQIIIDQGDSDSSDNDFEDVPEEEDSKTKTVVQLTLNVDEAPDDDIFADVFETKIIHQSATPIETTHVTPKVEIPDYADEDEQLQLAIKMSLEAGVESDENVELQTMDSDKQLITSDSQPSTEKNSNQKVTDLTKAKNNITEVTKIISKNQESLNIIQKEQITKPVSTNVSNNVNTTPIENNDLRKEPITTERLNDMVEEIQNEEQDLLQEKGRLDRAGRNITEEMTKDAQELLRMFGIPYIVAPMEAEAQCAFLESVNLTDGTITDDSDIWLFGGKTVYKNFFNQKKHVLQFLSERIEKSFNLSREQMILLALLVGSDYTTGLTGVGPVTALEILASFPFNKRKLSNETSKQSKYSEMIAGLQQFKLWVHSGKRTDNTSLKKKLRNVDVTDDFPSVRVVQAYLEPNIEKSEEKFTWGEIDITILRDYTKAKFGWSQHKLDEIIKPVLKRLVERKTQKTVHDYFKKKANIDSLEEHMSKRVKAAVQRMGPEPIVDELTTADKPAKPGIKRKVKSNVDSEKAGPSKGKKKKTDAEILKSNIVKVVSDTKDNNQSSIEIVIPKTDKYQEIIPQREKDKQSLLQNKMKAIELFRKTQMDKKKKSTKRKPILPKADAQLSESSDSN